MATFVAELQRLTEHCELGDSMDDMLRDRLVDEEERTKTVGSHATRHTG